MRAGRGGQCGLSLTTQELDEKRVEQDQAKFELQTSREERAANRRKTKDSEVDGADYERLELGADGKSARAQN
jgi:hypothetical protein